MMPSPKLARLQDEAATLSKTITDLRALEAKDDAEAASIAERMAAATARADEVRELAQREHDLDARIEGLRKVTAPSEPRAAVPGQEDRQEDQFAVPDIRAGVRSFRNAKLAAAAGQYLCRMAGINTRAMGETVDGYGDDYVVTELYNAIVNRLQYQSVAMQLASVFRPKGQKITLPKSGDFTFGFAAEGVAFTDQDISTSGSDLTLYEGGGSVAVSNSLLADSPIDVAGLIVDRVSYGLATWYDAKWLGGNTSNPAITGLAGAVVSGNTITVAANAATTVGNLADVVGKVDESIMGNGAWVCSKAGWVDLMKLWSAQQTTMTVGGGRVVPTIFGAPVYLAKGLPASTLALFGDFSMSSAVGLDQMGIQITVAKELLVRSRQTLFVASTRLGVANHAPEFVGRLAKA
jgi:HK97 family phage major capsid protein